MANDIAFVKDEESNVLEVRVTLPDGRVAVTGVVANIDITPHPDIPSDAVATIRKRLKAKDY